MDLTEFAAQVTLKCEKSLDIGHRLEFARRIAEQFRFKCPELVLFFTHPDLKRLTISDRCKKLGITEEQYLIFAGQEGFKKFLKEYQDMTLTAMRAQAVASASDALETNRYTYDKNGNESPNHLLETEILRGISSERAGPAVAVQVNNMWSQAKQIAAEKK